MVNVALDLDLAVGGIGAVDSAGKAGAVVVGHSMDEEGGCDIALSVCSDVGYAVQGIGWVNVEPSHVRSAAFLAACQQLSLL
jgi:hypothetical protein